MAFAGLWNHLQHGSNGDLPASADGSPSLIVTVLPINGFGTLTPPATNELRSHPDALEVEVLGEERVESLCRRFLQLRGVKDPEADVRTVRGMRPHFIRDRSNMSRKQRKKRSAMTAMDIGRTLHAYGVSYKSSKYVSREQIQQSQLYKAHRRIAKYLDQRLHSKVLLPVDVWGVICAYLPIPLTTGFVIGVHCTPCSAGGVVRALRTFFPSMYGRIPLPCLRKKKTLTPIVVLDGTLLSDVSRLVREHSPREWVPHALQALTKRRPKSSLSPSPADCKENDSALADQVLAACCFRTQINVLTTWRQLLEAFAAQTHCALPRNLSQVMVQRVDFGRIQNSVIIDDAGEWKVLDAPSIDKREVNVLAVFTGTSKLVM